MIAPLDTIDLIARTVALSAVGAAGLVVVTHWAVRRGHLKPFAAWPRLVRRTSDGLLQPLERRLVSFGRNPQDASLWLFVGTLLAALLLVTVTRWLTGFVRHIATLSAGGAFGWIRFGVTAISALLMAAIVIRVIGQWVGANRWNRFMGPFYFLTDWIIEPIRSRLPRAGFIDLSPLLAYLLVLVARMVILAFLPLR